MAVTIIGSVGKGGKNNTADVLAIQTLLNKWTNPPIMANGLCDGTDTDQTVVAIKAFQSKFLPNPDGRVDPGGNTLAKLNQVPFIQLPQNTVGSGYYSYSGATRQWGTQASIDTLTEIGKKFILTYPDTLMAIGDISFEFGGPMSPHSSHKFGKNVDLRPVRTDNAQSPVTYTDTAYDQEKTKYLIELFALHTNVSKILFNDPDIISAFTKVSQWAGHSNHFHINFVA